MLFTLERPTEAILSTFTARTEHHGPDLVSALTLGLAITGPNTILDLLAPGLRDALYMRTDDAQEALDGVEPPTPKLRTKLLGLLSIAVPEIIGGTLFVQWGVGEDMAFGDCRAGKWRIECFDGGSVTLFFKVSTSDVSEDEAGHLFGKQGQTIMIRFEPPAPQTERVETGQVIDGTTGHPGAGPLFDDPEDETDSEGGELDATDTFLSEHAENAVDDDDDPDTEDENPTPPAKSITSRRPSKYRDPETGLTWSGRGQKPRWLVVALESGRSLAELEVTGEAA